jgi:hypothetical protein
MITNQGFALVTVSRPDRRLCDGQPVALGGSPRAFRAGPSAWPVLTGRWAGRGSGAQGRVPKIVSAKRLETIFGCP